MDDAGRFDAADDEARRLAFEGHEAARAARAAQERAVLAASAERERQTSLLGATPGGVNVGDLWPDRAPVALERLIGTPEWLDALSDLPAEELIAQGLRFKLYDTTFGEARYLADWETEVPTLRAVKDRHSAGRYLVRASKRRVGRGGGNIAEVRFTIAGSAPTGERSAGGAMDLLREMIRAQRPPDAPAAARRADDGEAPAWFLGFISECRSLVEPHKAALVAALARLKEGGEGIEAATIKTIGDVLQGSGLLKAVANVVERWGTGGK